MSAPPERATPTAPLSELNSHRPESSCAVFMALDYGKWDDLYDSDEERQKDKRAEEAKRKADLRKAQLNPQPPRLIALFISLLPLQ